MRLIRGTSGLNNRINQFRLPYDAESGVAALAEAVNCDIDDSLAIGRRPGQLAIDDENEYHSVWCDGADAFCVKERTSDAAIYQIESDLSLTLIVSGLTKGARVSFCRVGDKSYWMNGFSKGVIESRANSAWPVNTHVGATTTREFYPAPTGTHVAYHMGCVWVVLDDAIFVSEPYAFGKFRLGGRFFQFGSAVRMVRPVAGGVWVSDSAETGFISNAEKFNAMSWRKLSNFPAHEWSENCSLVDLSRTQLQIPGLSAVWSSDDGLCVGSSSGELFVQTRDKLIYPTGTRGATVVSGANVINNIY